MSRAARLRPIVAIAMGSKSDYEVMKDAATILIEFKAPHWIREIYAQQVPDRAPYIATGAD